MKASFRQDVDAAGSVRIRLLLFGAFRDLAHGAELNLEVPRGTTVADLRPRICDALARVRTSVDVGELVESSALASDSGILAESHAFGRHADEPPVCLLPPVCGG